MVSLFDEFNTAFKNLIVKFQNCNFINDNIFSESKIKDIFLRFYKESTNLNLSISVILKYLLCNDILNIIRQAITIDQKICKKELVYIHKFVLMIYEIFGEVRPCYKEFCKAKEEDIYETIKFWHQDSDLLGFSNTETKFLLVKLISQHSFKTNNPYLFLDYKNLIIGVFSSIIKLNDHEDLFKNKVDELNNNLNIIFLKKFYNQVISEIVDSKILRKTEIKKHFSIESIDLIPGLKIFLNTFFESRTSFETLIPYNNNSEILPGISSINFDPWKVDIPNNTISNKTQFEYIVPESRRWNKCDKCKGIKTQKCSDCNGQKYKLCNDCMQGETTCRICSGKGEETFIETFEELVEDKDKLSLITVSSERVKKKPCVNCLTSGKVKCQTCNGLTKIQCKLCSGQGHINCKICDGHGKVEYNQVLNITRVCKNIEKVFFSSEINDLDFKNRNQNYTILKSLNGTNLSKNLHLEMINDHISISFLNIISNAINNEWVENIDLRPINQDCEIHISYNYKILCTFFGYQTICYWFPSFNAESTIKLGILHGMIHCFKDDLIKRKYFEAAKKVVYMENISKRNSHCLEIIHNHYKNLSLIMKFLVYVARHFVNPESIW